MQRPGDKTNRTRAAKSKFGRRDESSGAAAAPNSTAASTSTGKSRARRRAKSVNGNSTSTTSTSVGTSSSDNGSNDNKGNSLDSDSDVPSANASQASAAAALAAADGLAAAVGTPPAAAQRKPKRSRIDKSKLTPAERQAVELKKREDRARRNRASALKSRNKRRYQLALLETECSELRGRVDDLQQEHSSLLRGRRTDAISKVDTGFQQQPPRQQPSHYRPPAQGIGISAMAAVAAAARAHAGGGRAAGPNLRWAAVPSMNLDSPGSNVRQFANSNSQPSVQQSQAGSSQLKDHHMHQQARPMLHGSAGGASGARSRESSGESFGSADDPALQPSLGAGGGGRTSGATMTSGAYTKMVQAAEARILKLKQQKADATASVGRAEEHGESVDNASLEVAKLHSQLVEMKKKTRALKNKASAMRCREKKRRQMEDLQQTVDGLHDKVRHLERENRQLRGALGAATTAANMAGNTDAHAGYMPQAANSGKSCDLSSLVPPSTFGGGDADQDRDPIRHNAASSGPHCSSAASSNAPETPFSHHVLPYPHHPTASHQRPRPHAHQQHAQRSEPGVSGKSGFAGGGGSGGCLARGHGQSCGASVSASGGVVAADTNSDSRQHPASRSRLAEGAEHLLRLIMSGQRGR